jgi:Ca2+/Na+ antiporter
LYSLLNSLPFLILSFFSAFSSQTTLAVSTILGSDALNCFFLLAYIFFCFKESNHGVVDSWVTLRDTMVYLLVVLSLVLLVTLNFLNLYAGLIMLALYVVDLIVLAYNKEIKVVLGRLIYCRQLQILKMLDITPDDGEYNAQ